MSMATVRIQRVGADAVAAVTPTDRPTVPRAETNSMNESCTL